jgi:L-ascorbate metabolism protein UlaG (beta-lactamase superfamily)
MKKLKRIMIIFLGIIVGLFVIAYLFMQQKSFGKAPSGDRLKRIEKSLNYKNGIFVNQSDTPMMAEDASYWELLKKYTTNRQKTSPDSTLPSIKRDLKIAPSDKPTITWFGHSTLLIQIQGKNILVDPVFSQRASPVQYVGSKNYKGTDVYCVEDLPAIDYVFLTHDHYDHMDYETIELLKNKVSKFYTPLGAGSHLEHWGIPSEKIVEFDWWESAEIIPSMKLIATPARHFSGRGILDRAKTLWTSYVLITPDYKIFIGGDSGYDKHFKEIGEKLGPFDLVILEAGQYHQYWKYIHMMPEETVQASIDLKSKALLPVHWGKFTLALHTWNEPIDRVINKSKELNVKVTTPVLGEEVILDSIYPSKTWWKNL